MKRTERVDEIMGAWREEAEQGRRVEPKSLFESHPELAQELADRFAAQKIVDKYFAEADSLPLVTPERIGDYRIVREIGRGGMGVVYEAVQESMRRKVALKVLYPTIATTVRTRKRFEREARITGRLHHTNVVTVYAMGRDAGYDYFAMELIDGQPLDKVIAHLRSLDEGAATSETLQGFAADLRGRGRHERLAEMMAGVADALHVAHAHGVIHRDVKPSNLVLDEDACLKLTDFGLAQFFGDEIGVTRTGEVLGTPLYMSPEQVKARREDVDHRTDVYSLGATLYEALSLCPPHDGQDVGALCSQIVGEEPKPLRDLSPDVPGDLATIVHKALRKERADRYATAGEMAADLRAFAEGRTIRARPLGPVRRAWRRVRRHPVRSSLVGLLLVTLVGTGALARNLGRTEGTLTAEQALRRDLEYESLIASAHRALRDAGPPWSDALELSSVAMFTRRTEEGTAEESLSNDFFSRAIQLLPNRPEAYLERSLCWSRTHREAHADLEAARERGLDDATYNLGRAYVLYQEDRLEEARTQALLCKTPIGALDPVSCFLQAALDVAGGKLERTEGLLGRAIEAAPDVSITAFLARRMRGLLRLRAGENHDALADFLTVQQLGDRSFETSVRIAKAWSKLGKHERAEDVFKSLLEAAALRGPDGYIFLAAACSRCWSFQWSMRVAQAGIDAHGAYVPLVICRAEGIMRGGRPEAALIDIDNALDALGEAGKGTDWPLLRALRAETLLLLQRTEEALEEVRRAQASKPHDFDVLRVLASTLLHAGKTTEALIQSEALIDRFPLEHNGYQGKADVLGALGERAEAVTYYDRAIEIWPEHAPLHRERAWQLWRMTKLDEAAAGFLDAIALDPKYMSPRACLGGVYSEQKRLKDAETVLREAVAIDKDFAPARGNLGGVLFSLGQFKEAEGHLRFAAAREPKMLDWRETLGGVLRDTNRPTEALEAFEQSLPLARSAFRKARIHLWRAKVLRGLGKVDKALEEIEAGVRLTPEDPVFHDVHAGTLLQMGKYDEALEALNRAMSLSSDSLHYQNARVFVLLRAQRSAQALEEGWRLMAQGGGKPSVRIAILFRLAALAEEPAERYTQGFEWAAELYEQGDRRLRPGALLVHGSLAYRTGRIEEAIVSLKAADETRAGAVRVGALAFLALCFADRGERERADAYLERAKAAHEKQSRGRPEYDALLQEAAQAVESTPR